MRDWLICGDLDMSIEDEIEIFRRQPLLAELDQEALRILLLSTQSQKCLTGDIIAREGERSEAAYFVLSGSFALIRENAPDLELSVAHEGALIGEMALITQTESPATVRAREPSNVLKLPRNLFQRILREYPGSAARLRSTIERRLASFSAELSALASKTN